MMLGLDSAYEWKHEAFVFLSLAYLTQPDDLHCHHFPTNNIISFFFIAE
jgi:hypothetical protein